MNLGSRTCASRDLATTGWVFFSIEVAFLIAGALVAWRPQNIVGGDGYNCLIEAGRGIVLCLVGVFFGAAGVMCGALSAGRFADA